MTKVIADKSFLDLFPDAEIGVLALHGIDNSDGVYERFPAVREELAAANEAAVKWIPEEPLSKNEVVSVWRDAFRKFKKKKGNRSSIEALLARVKKGREVGCINPLVDIYNAASLTFALPVGGEDIDAFAGDLRLTITENGGDPFMALGDEENDPTLPGELCYLDDEGAVCRCWNWRDGKRTMLTPETEDALIIIENVVPARHGDVEQIMDRIAEKSAEYLGAGIFEKAFLNADNPEVVIK